MKGLKSKKAPRAYRSDLREEQAAKTRERILEAMAMALSRGGDEVDQGALAEAAGVSLRTIYHHFPNRDALLTALATWVDTRALADLAVGPRGASDLPDYARRLFQQALANEELTRATIAPGLAEKIRGIRRKGRLAAIDHAVQELDSSPTDAQLVSALLKHLLSGDTGVALIDRYEVSRAKLPDLMAWSTSVLMEALKRGPGPSVKPG